MRSGYGFTPVRVTHVPSTANERTTHWLRESFKFFPRSLALRTAHLARACCARDKCVVCAYPALHQFYCPMSTQNWRGPYRVSTCSALTTHVVRTDICSIYKRDFWRTSEGRSIYPPPPTLGGKNSRSSHFHALTTCEWVRTPYVSSTCKYGLRTITWQSHGDIRCKQVVSTYNSLTTCATYDARNRSRPGVACGPRTYTLRNRASDVRWRTLSLLLPLPPHVFRKTWRPWPPQKNVRTKNTHGGLWPGLKMSVLRTILLTILLECRGRAV